MARPDLGASRFMPAMVALMSTLCAGVTKAPARGDGPALGRRPAGLIPAKGNQLNQSDMPGLNPAYPERPRLPRKAGLTPPAPFN